METNTARWMYQNIYNIFLYSIPSCVSIKQQSNLFIYFSFFFWSLKPFANQDNLNVPHRNDLKFRKSIK